MDERPFDLVVEEMEQLKRQMLAELAREIYRDGAGLSQPIRPLTGRERWTRRIQRIRSYFLTLWAALRGDDPFESSDY